MKTILRLSIITILLLNVSCSVEYITLEEPCQCTKLYFNTIGTVIGSDQVTSPTCESVGKYPNDIQHENGTYFTINCYN